MATRTQPRPRPAARRPGAAFERLVDIMATLRGPNGCAWDRRQTHASLRGYLLEEAYEAVDAIDAGDLAALCGELGDVLLQCVFHAQLAAERRRFDIVDVVDAIASKLVSRHPHVFAADGRRLTARQRAGRGATTPEAVREQWARLKAAEQADAGTTPRVLAGVPRALPALLRAHKIGARVAAVGFDWTHVDEVVDKVNEELRELREAVDETPQRAAEEMGDLLFAVASLARKLDIDPEAALAAANDKFTARFDAVERALEDRGRSVHIASLDEMEAAWTGIKQAETAARRSPASAARSTSASRPPARRSRSSPRRRDRS